MKKVYYNCDNRKDVLNLQGCLCQIVGRFINIWVTRIRSAFFKKNIVTELATTYTIYNPYDMLIYTYVKIRKDLGGKKEINFHSSSVILLLTSKDLLFFAQS